MKRFCILTILCILLLSGCNYVEESHGIPIPYSLDQVESVELVHHTGDPSNAQQKWITKAENISYIYNLLSAEILVSSEDTDFSDQTDTLYITFHQADGTGYTVKFEAFGAKKGVISSEDYEPFSYSTRSDICWIWGQLAKDYEAQAIGIEDDPYAIEKPVAIGYNTDEQADTASDTTPVTFFGGTGTSVMYAKGYDSIGELMEDVALIVRAKPIAIETESEFAICYVLDVTESSIDGIETLYLRQMKDEHLLEIGQEVVLALAPDEGEGYYHIPAGGAGLFTANEATAEVEGELLDDLLENSPAPLSADASVTLDDIFDLLCSFE